MAFDVLEGELATYVRVAEGAEFDALYALLADKKWLATFDLAAVPDKAALAEDFEEESWAVWKIVGEDSKDVIGYVGFVLNSGMQKVVLGFFGQPDISIARDCIPLVGRWYFDKPKRKFVCCFLAAPVPDDIHEALLDAGFEVLEDLQFVDYSKQTPYYIARETFEAYYLDKDDEVEELDF